MEILITIVSNVMLILAAVLSAQMAVAWGELGSHPLEGDKSGFAGFGAVVLLMPMRWLMLAIPIAIGARRVALAASIVNPWPKIAVLLALHLALGIVAYWVFDWIMREIRAGNAGPQRLAVLFGLLLPTLIWSLAFAGVNRGWISRHGWIAWILMGLMIWSQVATWRQGYIRPQPSASPSPTAEPDGLPEK